MVKKISLGFLMGLFSLMIGVSSLYSCGKSNSDSKEDSLNTTSDNVTFDAYPREIKIGDNPDFLEGVTATLNGKALSITIDTTGVDLNKAGEYDVTYIASDSTGVKAQRMVQIRVVDPNRKIVYLTFDDGPSTATPEILRILRENDVHATFFITAQYPSCFEYIRQAYNEGNAVAAHTYSHNFSSIYSSIDAYFKDLDKIEEVIEKYTGKKSQIVRFPGGSSNTIFAKHNSDPNFMINLTKEVLRRGYQYVDWNGDSHDATGNNVPVSTLIASACKESKSSNELCILMHDTQAKMTTVEALPSIISFFKDKGYEFGTLTNTSYICHHGIHPYTYKPKPKPTTSPAKADSSSKKQKVITNTDTTAKKHQTAEPVVEKKKHETKEPANSEIVK